VKPTNKYPTSYVFQQFFTGMLRTLLKVPPKKFDFYVHIFVTYILNFYRFKKFIFNLFHVKNF